MRSTIQAYDDLTIESMLSQARKRISDLKKDGREESLAYRNWVKAKSNLDRELIRRMDHRDEERI